MTSVRPSLLALGGPGESHQAEAWAPMLSVRLLTQQYFAIRMGNLLWMEYNPSGSMTLRFSTHTIRILGRGLTPLYRDLLKLQCREIVVSTDDDETPGELVVTRVDIERKPGGDDR